MYDDLRSYLADGQDLDPLLYRGSRSAYGFEGFTDAETMLLWDAVEFSKQDV